MSYQNEGHHLEGLLHRAGMAVVTGSLVLSLMPTAALAEGTSSTTSQPPSMPQGSIPPDGQGGTSGQGAPAAADGGANTQSFDYSGSYQAALTADGESVSSTGKDISATESDQNAALARNGGTLDVTGNTFTKSGDDNNGDNCNFYGVNSILLAVGEGSQAYVSDSSLSSSSEGSNALFATDGATLYANNDVISTSAGNSRGLDATYGATIVANALDIITQGDHCAGMATDRGGGCISATNSSISTAGSGSPLLYSTGDIEVSNVTGTATGSQIAGMEGLNTILISNSTLESTQTGKTASDPVADGVIIYQSTSGDAETTTGETATFQAANSTLRSAIGSGSMFYFTNTSADVVLSNTTLDFDSSAANLILAAGNDSNNWGTSGSNGATVRFTCMGEKLSGDVEADSISSVSLYLTDSSTWTGSTVISANGSASSGSSSAAPVSVSVDGSSTWMVRESSTLTNLTVAEGGSVVDANGNSVTIADATGNVLSQGTSSLTVTVQGSYSTSYDAKDAGTLATGLIDRSGFDAHYGIDTSFSLGESSPAKAAGTTGGDTQASSIGSWWDFVLGFFKGLFGIA